MGRDGTGLASIGDLTEARRRAVEFRVLVEQRVGTGGGPGSGSLGLFLALVRVELSAKHRPPAFARC